LVLIGKGDATLKNLLYSRFTWGGSMSATAGPWGRHIEFNWDWPMRSSMFAYARSKGFFASLATEGSTISFDNDHNQLYYGEGVNGADILWGHAAKATPAGQELIDAINAYTQSLLETEQFAEQVQIEVKKPAIQPYPEVVDQKDQSILLVKRIVKDIKIYFDYDSAKIRRDAVPILDASVAILRDHSDLSVGVSGHTDVRGSAAYNLKLSERRAHSIQRFMIDRGIAPDRIKIISRGELDATAEPSDLVGMQRDRFAHFMIAELEKSEYKSLPKAAAHAKQIDERTYMTQEKRMIESDILVTSKEYTVQPGDSLWSISKRELGSGHRWKYLMALNTSRVPPSGHIKMGQKLLIPLE